MIITKGEIFTNIHCSGGSTYLSLLRNETYTKVGEALCLEIRRKDSRNEAQRVDQYEGSYVVRLLLLCLSPHLTFLLFLISFFRPDPPFLCFIFSTLCLSPFLLIRLSLLHFPLSFFFYLSLSLSVSLFENSMCTKTKADDDACRQIEYGDLPFTPRTSHPIWET